MNEFELDEWDKNTTLDEWHKEAEAYFEQVDEEFDELFRQRELAILDADFDGEPRPIGLRQMMDLRAKHIEEQH